jgi:hypothetical protein
MKIAINTWCENLRFDLYLHHNSIFRPSNSSRFVKGNRLCFFKDCLKFLAIAQTFWRDTNYLVTEVAQISE